MTDQHADRAYLLARPLPGVVGETRRVVHLAGLTANGRVTGLCGASFATADVEILDHIAGMPCEVCLSRAPGAGPRTITGPDGDAAQ